MAPQSLNPLTRLRTRRTRQRGTSLVEAMVTGSVLVVGLMAVAGATSVSSLLRQRGQQQQMVFGAMESRLEQIRGELFQPTALQTDVSKDIVKSGSCTKTYTIDANGDGIQDLSFAAGDQKTPILTVKFSAANPPNDATELIQVDITAQWYGVGGKHSSTLQSLVANRTGF